MQMSSQVSTEISFSQDRARVYRALAQVFRVPDVATIREACERDLPELCQAMERLTSESSSEEITRLLGEARTLYDVFAAAQLEELRAGHYRAFDESSGTRCAPTEMDQLGGVPQLELTRTFEMADVAGFYKAFGVEVGDTGERVDHIAVELEFMNLLAVKESIALQEEGEGEHAEICRNASRVFLRDHLGRWASRFGEALAKADGDSIYSIAGRLLEDFVGFDARRIKAADAPLHRIAIKDN